MITLIKKDGMYNVYNTPVGIIWVGRCTNPNIYSNPGYYLEYNHLTKDSNLSDKPFKTSKQAVQAFINYLGV